VDADADPFADFFDHRGRWKTAPARWQRDPAALAELAEFREVLARCLASLPRRIASLFWLREAEGKDTEQLCQELQVSATNVWTMLHRARARLRACLTANWFTRDVAP
jgi:RNA polymerase sigma-70 factor (ECF subfamily)